MAWDIGAFEYVPTGVTRAPGQGALTLTGQTPLRVVNHLAACAAAALTLTGQAPTVAITVSITPQVGAAALTGQNPMLALGVPTAQGTATLTGQAPALATTLAATVGSIALTGAAPTLAVTVSVAPQVGAATLTGQSPTLAFRVQATAGAATVTGAAPTVSVVTGHQFARPSSDVSAGTWTPSTGLDLYAMVDEETIEDTDYIYSSDPPDDDLAILALTPMSTPGAGDVTLHVRASWFGT